MVSKMGDDYLFQKEEKVVDEGLGYPKAYAKLCKDPNIRIYNNGPPFTFIPYALPQHEACRAKELDEIFPIIDQKAKPTAKSKIFASLLWKQLNHLGNAGFDPAIFRVDPYGNVLYYYADSASPLAWEIDHWFPCSRGGLTVPSNLKILQWQVCKKKNNNLEFLIPWWDLQLGISINQFLAFFASSNCDFRHRAFSMLFAEGESEDLNDPQTVTSHYFPHHFIESKQKIGLAPAAIVLSRRESYNSSSTLKSLDMNQRPRTNSPVTAAKELRIGSSKENENPNMAMNPYQAIIMARDSLRHKEENTRKQAEMHKLDEEMNELKRKTDDEKLAIQELELVLAKRKRRAEKCRRHAEAQSSYRAMLEKLIRDAMHRSVIYKEQVRLSQAAANALKARLEAQKAICDSSEKDFYHRFKQRDELESQVSPVRDCHTRKRSRIDDVAPEKDKDKPVLLNLPSSQTNMYFEKISNSKAHLHKELRLYLEEEQKTYEERLSRIEEGTQEVEEAGDKIELLTLVEYDKIYNVRLPVFDGEEIEEEQEENEESRRKRGKENVEKWLQMLLEDTPEIIENDYEEIKTDEIIEKFRYNGEPMETKDSKFERKDARKKLMRKSPYTIAEKGKGKELDEIADDEIIEEHDIVSQKQKMNDERKLWMKSPPYTIMDKTKGFESSQGIGRRSSFEGGKIKEKNEKEKSIARSESFRLLRRIPSSPSLILGMKKTVDYCIRRKSSVVGDDNDSASKKTFFETIKQAVKPRGTYS